MLTMLSQRVIIVTFVTEGRTLPHLRVECDLGSSVSDVKKQRYVHEFSSRCISDALEHETLILDSDKGNILENTVTPVQCSAALHSHHHP